MTATTMSSAITPTATPPIEMMVEKERNRPFCVEDR
jgi:hypothetical protein